MKDTKRLREEKSSLCPRERQKARMSVAKYCSFFSLKLPACCAIDIIKREPALSVEHRVKCQRYKERCKVVPKNLAAYLWHAMLTSFTFTLAIANYKKRNCISSSCHHLARKNKLKHKNICTYLI